MIDVGLYKHLVLVYYLCFFFFYCLLSTLLYTICQRWWIKIFKEESACCVSQYMWLKGVRRMAALPLPLDPPLARSTKVLGIVWVPWWLTTHCHQQQQASTPPPSHCSPRPTPVRLDSLTECPSVASWPFNFTFYIKQLLHRSLLHHIRLW